VSGNHPLDNSVTGIAERVRSGALSAVAVVERALDAIDRLDQDVRSVVWRDDDAALARAARLDALVADGRDVPPLAGVPMTVKDLFAVAGQPQGRASLAYDDDPAPRSALLVDAAVDAGLVQVGRAAAPELGMTTSGESDRWGVTRNPWDLDRSPGGSSGGSAASVAAGIVPVSLASDGGGSIRVPAAFCGVVGLKPSRGLLPTRVQGWAGGAVEGAITRTVRDSAYVHTHLARDDRHAWTLRGGPAPDLVAALERPTPALRVGLLTEAFDPAIDVDPACAAAARGVADRLRAAGHDVVDVHPSAATAEVMDIYPRTIIPTWLALDPPPRPELLPAHVQRHLAHAAGIDATTYVREVLRFQELARQIVADLFDDLDLLVTPTTATRVPAVGEVRAELLAAGGPTSRTCTVYERTLAFTTVPSVIGSPALSLPTHVDDDGLPLGVQLVGRQRSDGLLLQVGRDLEEQLRWTDRCPSVAPR
jgi:amidase